MKFICCSVQSGGIHKHDIRVGGEAHMWSDTTGGLVCGARAGAGVCLLEDGKIPRDSAGGIVLLQREH